MQRIRQQSFSSLFTLTSLATYCLRIELNRIHRVQIALVESISSHTSSTTPKAPSSNNTIPRQQNAHPLSHRALHSAPPPHPLRVLNTATPPPHPSPTSPYPLSSPPPTAHSPHRARLVPEIFRAQLHTHHDMHVRSADR